MASSWAATHFDVDGGGSDCTPNSSGVTQRSIPNVPLATRDIMDFLNCDDIDTYRERVHVSLFCRHIGRINMPRDFPNLNSLISASKRHKFRALNTGESEDGYRAALAEHVQPLDYIESLEIRNKVGWDKFTPEQNANMVFRRFTS
jgi:hypothetical protein